MTDEPPKRLTRAEKLALRQPLVLDDSLREDKIILQPEVAASWLDKVPATQLPKTLISLRVDPEVLDFFKEQGPGYQTRINAVLHAYMMVKREISQP